MTIRSIVYVRSLLLSVCALFGVSFATTAYAALPVSMGAIGYGDVIGGTHDSAMAGSRFTMTGDFDGDGHDDMVISATEDSSIVEGGGLVYIIYGSEEFAANNLSGSLDDADATVTTDLNGAYLATAIATGDLNGDGFDDLALQQRVTNIDPQEGHVYVFYGGSTRWNGAMAVTDADATVVLNMGVGSVFLLRVGDHESYVMIVYPHGVYVKSGIIFVV